MEKGLKKDLSLLGTFCVATGAMISSGLFVLPAIAYGKAGPAIILSYLVAGLMTIPAMMSKAELATAMPRAGGDYFFISRSMGFAAGTIGGFSSWFSLSLKSAFAIIGLSAYLSIIIRLPVGALAVFFCLVFFIINYRGVAAAARFQTAFTLALLGILVFYGAWGIHLVKVERLSPFMPYGYKSVFATAGFIFISYGGLTKVASIAEEIKDPAKNIPLGMILAIIVTSVIYSLVVYTTVGLLSRQELSSTLTPIADAATLFAGAPGRLLMEVAAMFAFITTANAGIMSSSRYPIAMSRDDLLPPFFHKTHRTFRTPHVSLAVTVFFMVISIMFLKLETLVKVASTLLIILFAFANISVIIMRESRIQNYQPTFKTPLYPYTQVLGILISLFLLMEMGRDTLNMAALFIGAALVWYWIYVRIRVTKEYALIHVLERITAQELTSYTLETELKEILQERDNIVEDRFDNLIKNSEVLDIKEDADDITLFKLIASRMEKRLDFPADELVKLFVKREKQTSTVIRPGLAIPHIIINGEKKFDIMLVRCSRGIAFRNEPEPVRIVFVLVGTRDERNFHLRALSAIAQVAQSSGFDGKWLLARNEDELRDIILLAERKRFEKYV